MITHFSSNHDNVASERASTKQFMFSAKNSMAISLAALLALGANTALADVASGEDRIFDGLDKAIVLNVGQSASVTSVPAVDMPADKKPNPWLIGGALALILGALIKIVGPNRVMNLAAEAGPVLQRTAETIANAPKAAAKALGSAVASPFRFLLLVAGVAMIGFTGISVFDLQWSAGIATGIGMTALTWIGTSRLVKHVKRAAVKVRSTRNRF